MIINSVVKIQNLVVTNESQPLKSNLASRTLQASLALVDHPSSDGVMIKMPYGLDVLHRPASQPIFSYWVG